MKRIAKKLVAAILGYQVRRLIKKNDLKIIGVVGSIGKTSTKLAIVSVLQSGFRVRFQDGNYNDIVTVPLIFFGEQTPSLFNPFAWLAIFSRNQKQLRGNYPYDVVVVELGSDQPGLIEEFKNYLNLEIGVITAITQEHMANFVDMDAVAKEELAISQMSSLILANADLAEAKYLKEIPELLTYAINKSADFSPKNLDIDTKLSEPELYSRLAAAAVAQKLGMQPDDIKRGLASIKPVPGRMQKLAGIKGSTIIDDSYNSSPAAVKLALDSLYKTKALQKIAVLGNMNELGEYSKAAHEEIGKYCEPKKLDLVLTIGPDANKYLAEAAEANGCKVQTFDSPYTIGDYLKSVVNKDAIILVKGSQNGVFAEEAIKSILANPQDTSKLVRQTPVWLSQKEKLFSK
jgi:UDP-N-acetylmuramoyl-tripeptide--D-alanyl-D-alanine ligase